MSPEIMNYLFLNLSLNFEVEVEIKIKDTLRQAQQKVTRQK